MSTVLEATDEHPVADSAMCLAGLMDARLECVLQPSLRECFQARVRMQARNLVKAGYHVTVWNRSPGKCKELEQEGASVASSSAECVAANDITIVMLADPAAALAVAKDAVKGISAGAASVIDLLSGCTMSTYNKLPTCVGTMTCHW